MTTKPYTREQPTQAELDAVVIENQKLLDEADANAREVIKQAEISADKRAKELRGEAVY